QAASIAPSPFPLPRSGGEDKGEGEFGSSPFNFIHPLRCQALEKSSGPFLVELWIHRFDAKKKSVSRCQLKSLHVENPVIGHRQTIERQQPEDSGPSPHQDRQLKRYGKETGPTI